MPSSVRLLALTILIKNPIIVYNEKLSEREVNELRALRLSAILMIPSSVI